LKASETASERPELHPNEGRPAGACAALRVLRPEFEMVNRNKEARLFVVQQAVVKPHRADLESDTSSLGYARKSSGVRPVTPEEEIQRLYRQLSDGSLDLSPPSIPPMLAHDEADEPITEQFELPAHEAPKAVSRDRAVLVRVDGPANGQVFSLEGAELVIGRGPSAGFELADQGVSRRHALLIHTRGHYFIQDLDSSNGTFLEGRRVKRAPLMEGDLIQFGPQASFRFCMMDMKQERAMMRLYEETTVDALTRVHNRRFIDKRFDEELAYALRHVSELSVVRLDVDYFKHINDRHGHASGDTVLRSIAELITDQLRTEDVLARYGGEEFLILLRGIPPSGAHAAAERVCFAISNTPIRIGRVALRVTVSAGCASLSGCPSQTKEDLIAQVDERLYRAKHEGRNQVCWD
jgi:two-component system, cell cycle response regulator